MKTILLMLIAAALLVAQTGNLRYTTPALIPAVDSAVFTSTVVIYSIILTNETTSDVTCTIKTKQATPRMLYDDYVHGRGQGSSHMVFPYPNGYQAVGGLSWYCSSASAVSAQIAYRQ